MLYVVSAPEHEPLRVNAVPVLKRAGNLLTVDRCAETDGMRLLVWSDDKECALICGARPGVRFYTLFSTPEAAVEHYIGECYLDVDRAQSELSRAEAVHASALKFQEEMKGGVGEQSADGAPDTESGR
jgi:hypothetical protein